MSLKIKKTLTCCNIYRLLHDQYLSLCLSVYVQYVCRCVRRFRIVTFLRITAYSYQSDGFLLPSRSEFYAVKFIISEISVKLLCLLASQGIIHIISGVGVVSIRYMFCNLEKYQTELIFRMPVKFDWIFIFINYRQNFGTLFRQRTCPKCRWISCLISNGT